MQRLYYTAMMTAASEIGVVVGGGDGGNSCSYFVVCGRRALRVCTIMISLCFDIAHTLKHTDTLYAVALCTYTAVMHIYAFHTSSSVSPLN